MPLLALLIILLALTFFLLLPVGIDGGYGADGFVLGLKIGAINIKMFPKSTKEESAKKAVKKRMKKEMKKEKPEKKEKDKKELDLSQNLDIIKLGLKALGRFRRRLRIDYLRIHCVLATGDPFDTAVYSGAASAAFAAFLPLLEGSLNIRERDFSIRPGFLSQKTELDIWLTTTLQILDVFYIAFAFGIEYLFLRIKQKRSQSKTERNEVNG